MANKEAEQILGKVLDRLQEMHVVRKTLAVLLVIAFCTAASYFVYNLLPKQYTLTVTGGDILSNRHYVAKVIQEEAAKTGITLKIKPTPNDLDFLDLVDSGQLDLAFIQGGVAPTQTKIEHVATLAPELLHFLVKPDIKTVQDIKGRTVNLGVKGSAARSVAEQVLAQAGLEAESGFAETSHALAELISLPPERLPDVVVVVSFAPAYVADYLVKLRGYRVLELPFPSSLALRLGWVADGKILAYTYSISPPVPEHDISTIGVKMHVVANKNVNPKAIAKLLEVIYGAGVQSRLPMNLDEKNIIDPSGYPLSAGTLAFMERNNPLLSAKLIDEVKAAFGLAMTLLSAAIVLFKWFYGKKDPQTDDKKFRAYLGDIAKIDARIRSLAQDSSAAAAELAAIAGELSLLKETATAQFENGHFKDHSVFDQFLASLADTRAYLQAVSARHT